MPDRAGWKRILIDGMVIVGSILLAFALDAWWSEQQARQTAYLELATVLEELRRGREEVARIGEWHDRALAETRSLRAKLDSAGPGTAVSVADSLVSLLVVRPVGEVPSTVLEAFVGSGRLEELRDPGLKRQLLAWAPVTEDLHDDEVWAREFVSDELLPYMTSEFDFGRAVDLIVPMWVGNSNDAVIRQTELRSTIDLRNLVALRISFLELLASQSRSVLFELDRLVAMVEQEVE